jgi:hypothetical protein
MLTGRPLFKGKSLAETIEQLRYIEPVSPRRLVPGVPRDLETICLKCPEKAPLRRYASAEALANDLRSFLNGEPITARPPGEPGLIFNSIYHVMRRKCLFFQGRAGSFLISGCHVIGGMSKCSY